MECPWPLAATVNSDTYPILKIWFIVRDISETELGCNTANVFAGHTLIYQRNQNKVELLRLHIGGSCCQKNKCLKEKDERYVYIYT
ncbi:hypothetical protein SDJN03_03797, partial [Cucurbita argyrosperma subsp. sororia]